MSKYRIRIEQLDYENNLKHQYQYEISEEMIHEIEKNHDIDALDEAWKRARYEFFRYLDKQKQR
jgi:hypothetical protein